MLPEEQLFKALQKKQAGYIDMYMQQNNLGGSAFAYNEDPLTSLLGEDFNNRYRAEYADTLHSGWFSAPNRLTARTGARLLNDINEMNDRGRAAFDGIVANKDRSLKWIRDINNSRIGVGGYTREAADKDYADIEDKLNMAYRIRSEGNPKLLSDLSDKMVKGKLQGVIDSLQGATSYVPAIAKPFVSDFSSEFKQNNIDESKFNAKDDKQKNEIVKNTNNVDFMNGYGRYLLPALLLGAAGGGLNKLNGGSFLTPLVIALLLGGLYGAARHNGYAGAPNSIVNSFVDKYTNKINNYIYNRPGTSYVPQTTTDN